MPKTPTLTKRQQLFTRLIAEGESIAQAYLKSGYSKTSIQNAGSAGVKLLKCSRIKSYLEKMKQVQFEGMALSVAEKRAFIARAVRSDLTSGKVDGDLVQEMKEEVDSEGNVRRTVKVVNKLDAIKEDNKMTGVYDDDKVAANPFLFLVTLGKGGSSLAESPALPASPAFPPAHSLTIEAETLPA